MRTWQCRRLSLGQTSANPTLFVSPEFFVGADFVTGASSSLLSSSLLSSSLLSAATAFFAGADFVTGASSSLLSVSLLSVAGAAVNFDEVALLAGGTSSSQLSSSSEFDATAENERLVTE